jgi:hypothetical protein
MYGILSCPLVSLLPPLPTCKVLEFFSYPVLLHPAPPPLPPPTLHLRGLPEPLVNTTLPPPSHPPPPAARYSTSPLTHKIYTNYQVRPLGQDEDTVRLLHSQSAVPSQCHFSTNMHVYCIDKVKVFAEILSIPRFFKSWTFDVKGV